MPHLVGLQRAGKQSYQLSYHTLRIAFNTETELVFTFPI
jgi:hypothetical protein